MVIVLMGSVFAFLGFMAMIVVKVSFLFYFIFTTLFDITVIIIAKYYIISGSCPRNCNGNGKCLKNGICQCADGFTGIDCSTGEFLKFTFLPINSNYEILVSSIKDYVLS